MDLIVTITAITEKSVNDHSNQMNTSLLMIPTIVMILTIVIAGIGSGSIPLIVTIEMTVWTRSSNHE